MNREDWKRIYGDVPEDFRLRLRSTLNGLEEREMKRRKASVVLIAATLILALMAGVGIAASQLKVFRMLDTAEPIVPLEGAEAMVATGLGSSENEYAVLTVEEAVFDGQGLLVQCRLSPRDAERYAMLNSFMQDTPEDTYITETVPAEVAEGSQVIETDDGVYTIINEADSHRLLLDDVEIDFPENWDEAQAKGIPVYEDGGVFYYGDYREYRVLGRRDGRQNLDYWITVYTGDDRLDLDSYHAEGQPDGSVLFWGSGIADEMLDLRKIDVHVSAEVRVNGEDVPLDEIVFDLPKTEAERKYAIQPVGESGGERFEILSGSIACTKVRAYLKLDYSYDQAEAGEEMGITFHLYDGEGQRIHTGTGSCREVDGIWSLNMEMQSFAEVPDTIWLEAKVIGEDRSLGRVECRLVEE